MLSLRGRETRVVGALVGSVVGDALGAPFEFGPPGQFSRRFPDAVRSETEMCGGRGWRPGEWTDDTQMSLIVAASLAEYGALIESDIYSRFVRWLKADPADVGVQTRAVLTSSSDWRHAAAEHFAAGNRAAGNGSLMRTTPAAIFFSREPAPATADAARRISALTHGDPAAGDGCAIYHRLIAEALAGRDPLTVLPDALAHVPQQANEKWMATLDVGWTPDQASEGNGAVWPTLGSAVWALRRYDTFESGLRAVIDLGGDTDTVAAVTGGLLGAVHGVDAIPARWADVVHGWLPVGESAISGFADLAALALRLDADRSAP